MVEAGAVDPDDLIGTLVAERFRLERLVSLSSSSSTFVSTDETVGGSAVIRLFTPDASATLGAEILEQAARVEAIEHPTITSVIAHGRWTSPAGEQVFVATARPGGGTLQDMIDRGRLLTPSQAVVVGVEVCRALDRAHRRGLVHHDLRPSAIMFSDQQVVSVTDIGVASVVADRAWGDLSSISLERARYSSPEQATGQAFDEKSDVYSLALVLVEAMTGVVPFLADSAVATLSARVDRLFPVSADLGPLAAVLERAGRADPTDRSSAAEMGRALVQAASTMARPSPLPIVLADATGEVVVTAPQLDATVDVSRPADYSPMERTWSAPSVADGGLVIRSEDEPVTPEPAAEEDRPLVGRWIVVAVAVLALIVGGLFAYRALSDDSEPVPDLAGLDEGSATNAVTEFGWRVETIEEFSEEREAGEVVRTEPAVGEKLDSGDVLTLVISSGPPPVPLPDLSGIESTDAVTFLANAGLEANLLDDFSEDVAPGFVVRWEVPEQPNLTTGDEVVKGTTVDVYISQGPEPRVLPDLRGQTYESAQSTLEGMRLTIARDEDQFFIDVPAGAIGSQTPAAGEKAERDSEVRVVVSKGPDVVAVPSIRRMSVDQIKRALTDAGLVVARVSGNPRGTPIALLINGQAVTAGQLVPRGSAVEIAYYG